MNSQPLFRERAMEQLSSPDQLDYTLRVTNPRGWLALGALFLLLSALVVWSFLGQVPTQVPARGILLRPGGVFSVVASQNGVVTQMLVQSGQIVRRGQIVARVQQFSSNGAKPVVTTARSPFDGRVTEVLVSQYDAVSQTTPLLRLERGLNAVGQARDLQAVLFVDSATSATIRRGMEVEIAPADVPPATYGFARGVVQSVSPFPVSIQGMKTLLGDGALAQQLAGRGSAIQVVVNLTRDADTPSGYAWTSLQGPPSSLHAGTLCRANITLRTQRPIELVFPRGR